MHRHVVIAGESWTACVHMWFKGKDTSLVGSITFLMKYSPIMEFSGHFSVLVLKLCHRMDESTLVDQVRVFQKLCGNCLEVSWASMLSSWESHWDTSLECTCSPWGAQHNPGTEWGGFNEVPQTYLGSVQCHEGKGPICLVHHGVLSACSSCSINAHKMSWFDGLGMY